MDLNNLEALTELGGEPGPTAVCDNSEFPSPDKEQRGCSSCTVSEDQSTKGYWSQTSISRSLQRAESLLRSTLNPSLKWLFHSHSQDEEEGNIVMAHNLVSRSSARLLRLQQALLIAVPQWQLLGGVQTGSSQSHYRILWSLLEQRSLLLFIHEYSRRAHLASAYISRVDQHLQQQSWSSLTSSMFTVSSLSQELRIHLNHWPCLFAKVQSDQYLRLALVEQTDLLGDIQQNLDSLSVQALVLMEQYVSAILSAVARTELDSVPREVLEEILTGTELYNQAVEEQRLQHSAIQRRTVILQQVHYSRSPHLSALTVKELFVILAMHHADMATNQLWYWVSGQSHPVCPVHINFRANGPTDTCCSPMVKFSLRRSDWTWEQLQQTYLTLSPSCSSNSSLLQSSLYQSHRKPCHLIPDLRLDTILDNSPALPPPTSVQQEEKTIRKDRSNQCLRILSQSDLSSTSIEASDSVQLTSEKHCKSFQTFPAPSTHYNPLPLSGTVDQSSVGLLLQVLVSSNDLLAALSHTSTLGLPAEGLLTIVAETLNRKADSSVLCSSVINTADPVDLKRMNPKVNNDQDVERTRLETSEMEITTNNSRLCSIREAEREETQAVGEKAVDSNLFQMPRSVQWLDVDQSLVLADLLEHYWPLLWTLCTKALWLHLFIPPPGNTADSTNLQDSHRGFQFQSRISQVSDTGLVPKESKTMLEECCVRLLVITANSYWDYVLCRCLGTALKDKCLINQGRSLVTSSSSDQCKDEGMSQTMEHFLMLPLPLLSSMSCHQSGSSTSVLFLLSS